MVTIIERTEAHYEVREVEFGKVYRWRPESLVLECDCGERPILTASMITCGECGAEHETVVREALAAERLGDEALRPWRYAGDLEDSGIPY
jgi:hypothetical protein